MRKATEGAGKHYGFQDGHDAAAPADWWFQESHEGLVLFVVMYTLACRWARCTGCNLPSVASGKVVPFDQVMKQADWLFEDPGIRPRLGDIEKVILSNNGSVLDEETFSSTALMYFVAQCNLHLPKLAVLSMETRPEYVDIAELEFLARALAEGPIHTRLELAIGFEAFDEEIRNHAFQKGLSLRAFEELVAKIAPYGFHLKCYFMQKPVPSMSDAEAVDDVHRAIDYLDGVAGRFGVPINLHLNPTYVASGTPIEEAFLRGEYTPPRLADVAAAVRGAAGRGLSVFIGLSDEGLAAAEGSFIRPGEEAAVAALNEFNRTQDYACLDAVARVAPE